MSIDLAVSLGQLAGATRQLDEALQRANMRPDMAIIMSILLAEFAAAMPNDRTPRGLRVDVGAPDTRLAAISVPTGTPGWPPSCARVRLLLSHLTARWGTVHESGESVLWLQLPPFGTGASMAQAAALARAMTQLATARTYGEVAGVLDGSVAPRIDATWSALGVCAPDGVRMVAAEGSGTADAALPLDAELPVTAVCRAGRPMIHTSQAEIALKFPRLHARMVGARLQSLAHLPATAAGRTIAVLCFGWTDSTHATRHRWLLTVLADLVGEAVARIGAPSAAAPDQRPERRRSDARGLQVGRVEVDIAARAVHISGRLAPIVLGGREFALLLQLLRQPGTVQPRRELLERVWGPSRTDTSVVDVTMSRLRRKLDLPELVTVPNEGYLFDPDRIDAGRGRTRLSGSLLS